jgi:hypothetical protein
VENYERRECRDSDSSKQVIAKIQHIQSDSRSRHYLDPCACAKLQRDAFETDHNDILHFEYFFESE